MKTTTSNIIRWAGVSAVIAGICYVVVGMFHPVESLATVTTARWAFVHTLAVALSFFGLLGITGIYARQVEKSGWLGLVGYILLCVWLVLLVPFTFTETFILPRLASESPAFVESFLGIFNGQAGTMDLGAISALWGVDGLAYMAGGLIFGIATFRAAILSRWAAGLLAAGTTLSPIAELLPVEIKAIVAVPVGLAFIWLGYALWVDGGAPATQTLSVKTASHLRPTAAE